MNETVLSGKSININFMQFKCIHSKIFLNSVLHRQSDYICTFTINSARICTLFLNKTATLLTSDIYRFFVDFTIDSAIAETIYLQ